MAAESLEHLPIQAGDRAPFRLFDITGGPEHVLLVYWNESTTPEQGKLVEFLAQTLLSRRCRVAVITAPGTVPPALTGFSIIIDAAGQFAAYAPSHAAGYLIRPDGYIGYHARPVTEQGVVDYPVHGR